MNMEATDHITLEEGGGICWYKIVQETGDGDITDIRMIASWWWIYNFTYCNNHSW